MNIPHFLLLIVVLIISAIIVSKSFQKRRSLGAVSLIFFACGLLTWTIAYLVTPYAFSQFWIYFWLTITFLAASTTRIALFIFALRFTDNDHWLNRRTFLFFLIEPVISLVILITNPSHGFFYTRKTVEWFGFTFQIGPWFWITTVYNFSLLLLTIMIIGQTYLRLSRINRRLSGLLFAGVIAPVVLYVVTLVSTAIIPGSDLSPVVYLLPGITVAFSLFRNDLLDYSIQSRDSIIEMLKDGWLVLDENNRVIDLNPVAEQLINRPREEVFGLPAETVLTDWPNVTSQIGNTSLTLELNCSLELNAVRRNFNVRVHPLIDHHQRLTGHIIFWRDITEQKRADESRKLAREETFVLLHAVAGAASEAPNLESFFSEIDYLIKSAFQCNSKAIFLLDEKQPEGQPSRLSLVNQVGLSAQQVKRIAHFSGTPVSSDDILSQLLEKRLHFISHAVERDPLVPAELREIGPGVLLAAPLRFYEQILGLICIVRKPGAGYNQEEIARFMALAGDVSNFIYNDRQRQLVIALAERARLVRDLHDSITQRLCGLVALTEAAQAGLEVGSIEMSSKVISQIGEHARQALREMRLFLHELSPSNLKKDGLIAALNQRLDAVEGRTNIKRNIVSDENIFLTDDQQVAIFYIAQEALNNILWHANANSIQIRLKQSKTQITLEIEDDGSGFNTADYKSGGIGLRSMHERAEQIGGTLTMQSEPGKGTKIRLAIRK
jgi:PAS domain S-box-containing protein